MGAGYARVNMGIAGTVAAPAAGANSGNQALNTPDDSVNRRLTGVMITDTTKGGHTQIFNGQKMVADIGHDMFLLGNRFATLDEDFQAGISFKFTMFNDSAGALSANPGVIFRYHTGEQPAPSLTDGL